VKRKGFILWLTTAIAVALSPACSRPLKPQESCNFVQNSEQQRLSWEGQLPVRLYVHSSVPAEAYEAIDHAIVEYNQTLGGAQEIFKIVAKGVSGDLNPTRDGYSMIYWFNQWDANRPTEQARTTIYWTGSKIFEADIRINAEISYSFGVNTNASEVDLTSLLVHELGHVLGLAHNVSSGSVMNITLQEGHDRRKVGAVDMTSLKCEY